MASRKRARPSTKRPPAKKAAAKSRAAKKGVPKKAVPRAVRKAVPAKAVPKKAAAHRPAPRKAVAKRAAAVAAASPGPHVTPNDVSPVFAGNEARFLALRAADPGANLRARLDVLRGRLSPERFAEDFGYAHHLLSPGWAIMAFPEDGVIYTLGLNYHFGQPELLIGSQPLREQPALTAELTTLLNEVGQRVAKGLRLMVGDFVEAAGKRLALRAYGDAEFERSPCGYLATFEEMFEDRFHESARTLPVLSATLA
jgi:hypothetical protein